MRFVAIAIVVAVLVTAAWGMSDDEKQKIIAQERIRIAIQNREACVARCMKDAVISPDYCEKCRILCEKRYEMDIRHATTP